MRLKTNFNIRMTILELCKLREPNMRQLFPTKFHKITSKPCPVPLCVSMVNEKINTSRNYRTFIFKKQKLNDNIDFSINSIVFLLILVHNNNSFIHWEIGCMIRKCQRLTSYVYNENMDNFDKNAIVRLILSHNL